MKLATLMLALVAALASCVVGTAFVMPSGMPTAAARGGALAPSSTTTSRATGASAVAALNVKVIIGEDENTEAALARFRRTVSRAGNIQDLRWRRQFETVAERKKRKKEQLQRKKKILRSRARKFSQNQF